jgi:protein-S-isoprenylcysteine O-methyltransferase Ste14
MKRVSKLRPEPVEGGAGDATNRETRTPYLVIPVFFFLITTIFIRVEEEMLEEKFGQSYLDYKQHVRRWI